MQWLCHSHRKTGHRFDPRFLKSVIRDYWTIREVPSPCDLSRWWDVKHQINQPKFSSKFYCFTVAASHMEEEQSESGDSNIPADRKPKKTSILDKITAQTVKQILELLCDESVSTSCLLLYNC